MNLRSALRRPCRNRRPSSSEFARPIADYEDFCGAASAELFVSKWSNSYVGFKRTQDEYGGSWAMAQFILATETHDENERNARMAEILKYNAEDLEATWAVFEWLREK